MKRASATLLALAILLLPGCSEQPTSPDGAQPGAPTPLFSTSAAGSLTGGGSHTCGLTADGAAYCWGANNLMQLGYSTTEMCSAGSSACSTTPGLVPIVDGRTFLRIAGGFYHTCALANNLGDNTIFCWGDNTFGQSGGSNTGGPPVLTPTEVRGQQVYTSVTTGASHSCGLADTGYVYCWGLNAEGQLGSTTTETCGGAPCSSRPRKVQGSRLYSAVVAGGHHTCAIAQATSQVYCWGRNANGQLGNATTTPSTVPMRVKGNRSFGQLTAGDEHTCAAPDGGIVYCWGRNVEGQLGTETNDVTNCADGPCARQPRQVMGSISFGEIGAGGHHTCAIGNATSYVYCWGQNDDGELGRGDYSSGPRPRKVKGTRAYDGLGVGADFTCARSAGAVYCWGYNASGQIARNSDTQPTSLVPLLVSGLTIALLEPDASPFCVLAECVAGPAGRARLS